MAGKGNPKTGGRKKGTPNRSTIQVVERLQELGSDPVKGLAEFADGITVCRSCNAKGKVTIDQYYMMSKASMPKEAKAATIAARSRANINCPQCLGTKERPVSDIVTLKARSELMNYIAPKRKAVDINHNSHKTFEELIAELDEDENDD